MGCLVVGDRRDEPTWVAIRLTRSGEILVSEGTLEASLRRDLDVDADHPIFIPTAFFKRDGKTTTMHLMEGYVFLGTGLSEVEYFGLEKRPYIDEVMSTRTGPYKFRYVSTIPDSNVARMRVQLQEMVTAEIPLDVEVDILDGQYRGLEGRVIGLEGADAFVRIRLRSLEVVATVPKIFLEQREEE